MASPSDRERKALGRRWLPGIASLFLGTLAAFAVLCLHYPERLTTPELRAVYPMDVVRAPIAGAWPARYGVLEDEPPPGFAPQLVWPFSRRAG